MKINHSVQCALSTSTTQTLSSMCSTPIHSWASGEVLNESFSFVLANNPGLRQRAYSLANEAFYELGYVDDRSSYIVDSHDCDEDTFTLLVLDKKGKSVATISLYFDKFNILPCDEVFREEINSIRGGDIKIGEVVRLAVAPEYRKSKMLITHMFNMIHIYAYHIMGYSDLVIEVKQSHARYYERLLGFEILGKSRTCSRVNNTIANILHIPLKNIEKRINAGRRLEKDDNGKKNIFKVAFSKFEEKQIIQYFLNKHLPMTKREMSFYEISLEKLKRKEEMIELVID